MLRVKSKIIEAVYSGSAKRRRWGFDAMFDAIEFRDSPFASARVAPPPRPRGSPRAFDLFWGGKLRPSSLASGRPSLRPGADGSKRGRRSSPTSSLPERGRPAVCGRSGFGGQVVAGGGARAPAQPGRVVITTLTGRTKFGANGVN